MFNSGLFHTSHASTMQATPNPGANGLLILASMLGVTPFWAGFLDVDNLVGYMPPFCFNLVS